MFFQFDSTPFLLSIVKNLILVNFCWIFPDLDHDKVNHSKLLVQSLTCAVFHSPASPCCLFTFLFLLFCLLPNTSRSHTSCLHFSFEYLSHGTPGTLLVNQNNALLKYPIKIWRSHKLFCPRN